VAIGIVLLAPYIPMLFMGEEWAASSPFLYFADHEDEELRRSVAEGRKREFAGFGFDQDVPNPEDRETYEKSKLNWEEQNEGKHADMLAWAKSLIKLRHSNVCLNDGDMHHMKVSSDEEAKTFVVERDEARILINFGEKPHTFTLLNAEKLELISRTGTCVHDNVLDLPPMTLAVLMSPIEEVQDRQVAPHVR
jgi:maltooligosyltrehalose trehalohydrolase